MTINCQTNTLSQCSINNTLGMQFPVVSDTKVGEQWDLTYGSVFRQKQCCFFDSIGYYSNKTKTTKTMDFGRLVLASEPLLAGSDDQYVMTVLFEPSSRKSYLNISDPTLSEIICEWQLPHVIPPSFHGKWQNLMK